MELDLLKKFNANNISMWNPNTNYLTYLKHFEKILNFCIENNTYRLTYQKWLNLLNSDNGASKIGGETHNICHGLNIIDSTYTYGNVSNPNGIIIIIPRDLLYQYIIDGKQIGTESWKIIQNRYFKFLNHNNIFELDGCSHIQRVCLNLYVCYLLDTNKANIDDIVKYISFAKDSGEQIKDKINKVYNYDVCKPGANILEKMEISSNGKILRNAKIFEEAIMQSLDEMTPLNEDLSPINVFRKFYNENIDSLKNDKDEIDYIRQREEFKKEYPIERIRNLKIDEYVLGNNRKDTLSYYLEFGKYNHAGPGIGGSTAAKHGLYMRDGKYYGMKNEQIDDPYDYWSKFINQLADFYEECKDIDKPLRASSKYPLLQGMSMVLSKILYVYYPNKFINICSKNKLRTLLKYFNYDFSNDMQAEELNFILSKNIRRDIPEMLENDPQFIGSSLWKFVDSLMLDDIEQLEETDEEVLEGMFEKYDKNDFLNEVFIDEEKYDSIVSILEKKKNIILEGAPGVGKTFMAKRLAYSILGEKNTTKVKLIQFHQSYSYEDFIEGFRPTAEGFSLEKGVFYRMCSLASEHKDDKFYLIIDEINRGNLSKILGELMMLIESDKRGDKLKLAYSQEDFYVPSNLYIIGLMNTADRSLAIIDYALRRRFSFIRIEPAFENEKFIKQFNEKFDSDFNNIIDIIKKINIAIENDKSLGSGFKIGHSYFCPNLVDRKGNKKDMEDIITYEILPLLEEYWYDDEDSIIQWKNVLIGVLND